MDLKNICLLYFYYFIMFGYKIFVVKGNCHEDDDAIPICKAAQRTGRILYIDTSAIPTNMLNGHICSCGVSIRSQLKQNYLYYKVSGSNGCGIKFDLAHMTLRCETIGTYIGTSINQIIFEKTSTVIRGSVCLKLYIDKNVDDSKTNATATVTCYSVNPNTSALSSASSEWTTTSSTWSTMKSSTDWLPIPGTENTTNKPSATAFTISTDSSTKTFLTQTDENYPSDSNPTVIIAASAGGGSFLLLIITLLTVCCYRKRQKSNQALSPKHEYVNPASDHVVTDNVVYNMEFPDDKDDHKLPVNDVDTTYATVDEDTKLHSNEGDLSITYKNLQINEDRAAYKNVNFDTEHDIEKIRSPFENNTLQIIVDGGADKTIEFEENTRAKNKILNSQDLTNMDSDIPYDTLGQIFNTIPINALHNQEPGITYAIVNKGKPCDKNYDRPKQFQIPDSGDTYALVKKE